MLDFSDLPYQYFPPRRNALIAWLLRWHNRLRYLPAVLKIERVEVSGLEALRQLRQRGDRLLLLPNHPTHADAAIFVEAARQAKLVPQFMAAYDVFLRSRRDAFVMQRLGSFSVDREGSDQRAMKQAMASLMAGRYALTIFPEGNVYLENDRVTPFHDGAAFLAVRAAKELEKRPGGARVLAVPISIKATFAEDVRPVLKRLLQETAATLGCEPLDTLRPLEALRHVGTAALRRNLKQRDIAYDERDDLPSLIEHTAERVLDKLPCDLLLINTPEAEG